VNEAMHRQGEQGGGASAAVPAGLAVPAPLAAAMLRSGLTGPKLERPAVARPRLECGDLPLLIKRDGQWLYRGSPIARKEMVCLFASMLTRDEAGEFWLETPAERGRVAVEDAPFVAVEMTWAGCGRQQCLTFRTNVDELISAGPEHPIRIAHDILTCEPTPYLLVRPGLGRHPIEARICRAVYYELVALAEPGPVHGRRMLGVWSRGRFQPLGEMVNEEG
jgi:hypothetical protein